MQSFLYHYPQPFSRSLPSQPLLLSHSPGHRAPTTHLPQLHPMHLLPNPPMDQLRSMLMLLLSTTLSTLSATLTPTTLDTLRAVMDTGPADLTVLPSPTPAPRLWPTLLMRTVMFPMSSTRVKQSTPLKSSLPMPLPLLQLMLLPQLQLRHQSTDLLPLLLTGPPLLLMLDLTKAWPIIVYICFIYF